MKLSKLLLATVGATVLLGALVGGASARNFSRSNLFITVQWRGVTFNGAFGRIVCPMHAEGSFHARTYAKRASALLGYITQATFSPCSEQSATILREALPWHIRYLAFAGVLPNILNIRYNFIGVSLRVREAFGLTCLARSTEARPAIVTTNRDVSSRTITTATITGTVPTDCFGAEGTVSSEPVEWFLLGSSSRVTITLI